MILPLAPTATNFDAAKAIPSRSSVTGEGTAIHEAPSGECRIEPPVPTATNVPSPFVAAAARSFQAPASKGARHTAKARKTIAEMQGREDVFMISDAEG
jgi:hypothetical protein